MEVGVRVEAENLISGKRSNAAYAYIKFVAIEKKKQKEVQRLICEKNEEKRRFEEGRLRREKRLSELKEIK